MPFSRNPTALTANLEIAENPAGDLELNELTAFLGLYGAAYQRVARRTRGLQLESPEFAVLSRSPKRAEALLDLVRALEERASIRIEEEPEPIVVLRISFESPLKLTLGGSMVAIALAAVLSGGSIEVSASGVKANLPPLAVGIAQLRIALGPQPIDVVVRRTNEAPNGGDTVSAGTKPPAKGSNEVRKRTTRRGE